MPLTFKAASFISDSWYTATMTKNQHIKNRDIAKTNGLILFSLKIKSGSNLPISKEHPN